MSSQPALEGSQRPRLVAQWQLVTDCHGRVRPEMRWGPDAVASSVAEREGRPEVTLIA